MEYKIQGIVFNGKRTHRILQNVGGPCPLLGLCNVLLLNNDIRVNQKVTRIKFEDLTFCLKDHLQKLFELNMGSKNNVDESQMANQIQNIEDCVQLFPKLEEGLDINVKFSDCTDFEFTSAVAMFDNYNIRLLHGWVIDPQQIELYSIMKDKSYNEIVDFLTSDIDENLKDDEIAQQESQKVIVRQFLNDFSQQLTSYGLIRMHECMNNNEIAIFFRNNHFSAMYKRGQHIYELVTDQGIVDADSRITWQSLSQLTGDEEFLSNKFTLIQQNDDQQQQLNSYNAMKDSKDAIIDNKNNNNQDNKHLSQEDIDLNNAINASKQDMNNDKDDTENRDDTENKDDLQKIDKEQSKPQTFTIEEQEKYLQQQYNESNNNNNNNNNQDDEIAQNIALEQQLGLESGGLQKLKKEQENAMKEIQQQKIQSQHNHNPQYQNQYRNNGHTYTNQNYDNRKKPKKKKKKKRKGKDDDDCVIL